ncbi:serine/threonine-protein kinase SMG1 [Ceratina calcarata]|uniref:non-specific serine/threonine protein kinase n=1 Tax=Ceratina calcarata TaxID=156304 RepID=A0AAJ7S5C5_9HYME|nr:serine/threonine-protein kinase SMG1 [Ceratina calcarata]XP_026671609.1 serine/threonine-protein kinase SMG1 [Ceratina calcarata]XP_026671610.1 serine/threonine-protein kinase SMG1 [Ceratina calcarata]XP_026671611.1 serine/threonine-protein kinase SMG1 [Ceratina calcarata]
MQSVGHADCLQSNVMNSCGNSNISTKLRGSKCSEIQEESVSNNRAGVLEKGDVNVLTGYNSNDFNAPRDTLVICQRTSNYPSDHSFSRFKPRIGAPRNEFRMARGGSSGDRARGALRGRAFKKTSTERDANTETSYYPTTRSKFQESLKNQENAQGKYYDDKRINEDSRISKLLRRLYREDDYDHFMTLCKQAQEGIIASENQRYIRRNLDIICESLLDVLYTGPGPEAKQQVAKCLGRVGYAAEQDFKRYMDWVFNKCSMERKDDIKCLLIKSFVEAFKLDAETSRLKEFSVLMMSQLQSTLENVDRSDLLVATVDAILLIMESYPETFSNHFRDTVDILVGWHIDSTQQKAVAAYASRSLQRLRSFWIADLQFTLTLLGQFLEDMESYDEELSLPESGRSSPGDEASPTPRECIRRIASLISVFNTVTKSISEHLNPNLTPNVQWSFLSDCLSKMLKTVVKAIELDDDNDIWLSNYSLTTENADLLLKRFKNLGIVPPKNSIKSEPNEENIVHMLKSLNLNKNELKTLRQNIEKETLTEERVLMLNAVRWMELKGKKDFDLDEEKEELIIVANECAFLLLGHLQSRITKNHELLYKFIDLQLKRINSFWDDTIISMLNTISKIIKEVSANLPLELVHKLLGKDSALLKLRFRNSIPIQNASLGVYHSLLSLKNIPLLQESYRYILSDLEIAYKLILADIESLVADNPLIDDIKYKTNDTEIVVTFLLRALSDIANASNSIIGMWALKPSVLELLAVKLKPYDISLSTTSPFLQYSILYLLYAHCSRYNHFVPSSSLITGTTACRPIDMFPAALDVPTTSPTSGHLSIILNVIAKSYNEHTPEQTLLLLSTWMQEIYIQSENYIGILSKTKEYENVLASLISCGASIDQDISIAVCDLFEILMSAKNVTWKEEIYASIVDLVMLHLTSRDEIVREKYGSLLTRVPLNIVIPKLNREYLLSETKKYQGMKNYSTESLIFAQRLHMRGNNNGEMQAQHFKTYMAFLLQEQYLDAPGLSEIFTLCWPIISESETTKKMYRLALANRSFLYFWAGFEAAQHCVTNKLRTSLGKPQETFTSIESALKTLAREISYSCETTKKEKRCLDHQLTEHTRVRLFIEFLEHLERVIHNAAEGCAIALLPLSKPVRTFFHTNKSTCKEWLNRIRLALCVVSLHSGLATSALRNSQRLLEDLSNSDNTQGIEFERATLCTAQAMVMLGEAEALQGLYVYTKERERKFSWLKAAMEEAANHYESAAEAYKLIIEEHMRLTNSRAKDLEQEEDGEDEGDSSAAAAAEACEEPVSEGKCKSFKSDGDNQVLSFCMQRLCYCYEAVSDWSQLESWKQQQAEILAPFRKDLLTGSNASRQARCLRKFENNEDICLDDLTDWNLLNGRNDKAGNWSCSKKLVECSNSLTNIALRLHVNEFKDYFDDEIERCRRVAAKTMEEGLRNVPSEYMNESILVRFSADGLKNLLSGKEENVFELYKSEKLDQMNSSVLTRTLWWSEYFGKAKKGEAELNSNEVTDLRLHIVRTARKEGNFELAKRELFNYLRSEREVCRFENHKKDHMNLDLDQLTDDVLKNIIHVKWSKNNIRAFREYSKLLYDMECTDRAVKLCSATALGISRTIVDGQQSSDLRENGTILLLTLGKWMQQEVSSNENGHLKQLLEFEAAHNDGLMNKLFGPTADSIPVPDMIIGRLTQLGVNQCPDLPLAWCSFASWCYKWGRKIVDSSSSGQLTDTDRTTIRDLLPFDTSESDLNAIFSILSQSKSIPEDEGEIADTSNDVNTSDMIETQLRSVPVLNRISADRLGLLVDIWRQAQKRIYSYYELSANAYFKYLQLAAIKETNDCATITATLRLLRLVVKHALELQNVLESGLSSTPTAPWKEIIPQLFSRLSHPESYVRTRVSELLCRVAENSPHLITFPAVIGAVSGQKKNCDKVLYEKTERDDSSQNDLDFIEEEDEMGTDGSGVYQDEQDKFMDCCFSQLVDCLSNKIQDSIEQVKILVKELRRITLLWDELWLATLCQHHTEISKRFEQLEMEVQKVQDNAWLSPEEKEKLIAEKHRIILKPIVFILENLSAMTSVPAETPHEKNFQEKFGPSIEEAINKLNNPKNPAKPQIANTCLKQLESKLAQRVHRRAAYSLSMNDISPTLASLRNTCIAMPGVAANDNKIVTIESVDSNVQILPTKTKPKKLVFHGSDGHVYTYLFKGLEDLHLDERIMQFLSICNTMMSKKGDSKKVYRARHYSVIPLGPRSGLIQWVDGVTPLFVLYKRWQQRESAMLNKTGSSAVLRPSELFYNKLTPLLKERGIGLENRKEWPIQILKQVLTELMAETPKDLLAKEIWCNSINAGSWWQATKNYSYSVAVMSIIGYIIGLGDRHLDNVLVDLNTGEVVHIDYNVCFEKGKTLRVPEKVPFRMTPNIRTALGVTGVEGIFRLACEHTLRVMRRGRETLLTLLEAFIYDPLVDWRAGADNSIASYGACQARARCTGIGRKQLEQELTRAMFAVRTAEMRAEWLANRDELVKIFPLLCHHLTCWVEATEATRQCQDLLQDRHQQLALVKEAQAMGRNHPLYSVTKRYNSFKRARDAHEKAKTGLKEKIEDCEKQINLHNMALSAVKGPQLGQWLAELGTSTSQDDHVVFDLVKEFLQNAGQSQMILQCEQSENELTQLATQQSILIRNCLDLLSQYSAICSLYPLTNMSQHRTVLYHGWANKLLNSGNVEACREVIIQFESTFDPIKSSNNQQVQQIIAFSYQMQAILNEANERLKKAYERIVVEGLPESVGRIEKTYTESRVQIQSFLRREKGAEKALECVNITALCALNKRYLMMEGAAKCAGDCLVDLTSREGDWFLDEMRLMSSLIAELISLIPECHKTNNDPKISLILKCLRRSDCIYKGLQELNYNFHTIILPEAMKTVITEEPTVIRMIAELTEIILSSGISLGDILGQLEMHLRFTVMEMDSPHAMIQNVVNNMRIRFEALLSRPAEIQEPNQDEALTPGQMLLMGFNGLFEKLQMEGNILIATLNALNIPPSWRKIDQIREAKEMSAPIFNKTACQVLEDIFLVKRLHTIQEFFMMCTDIATAFKGGLANVYNDERLNKPIRIFTADYVSRQLLGVTSQTLAIALCFLLQRMGLSVTTEIEQRDIGAESKVSLEELCRKVVDLCLKRGLFTTSVLTQASALSSTLESAWRRKQGAKFAQQCVEVARASMQRLQLQLTAHHWLHEDSLLMRSNVNVMNPLNRSGFMLELRKTAAALSTLQSRVCEAREQQQNLVSSAVQRLKWAAGANPALGEVMSAFDNAVLSSCEKLTRQHNLATNVINTCNSILHYEALRTRTSESLTHDTNFVKLIKHWEESCLLTINLNITVTGIEESLVELLQMDSNVDINWLKQAERFISEAILDVQKKLQEKQECLLCTQERLREQVSNLQSVLTEHHRLMSDVRILLRSMVKQENIDGLQEFLASYRAFTERISTIVKELESDGLDVSRGRAIKEELENISSTAPTLYNELLEFANEKRTFEKQKDMDKDNECQVETGLMKKKGKLMRQEGVCYSPRKGPQARDPTTGKAVQERNAYALNVWHRVRMKLEGCDPHPTRKYTTAEQVEYVIREAQSTDNLALLYEGWTPWV